MSFIYVALGGAIGATARYSISLIPLRASLPVHTLVTNIIGAIAIGFIVGLFSKQENASKNALLFWKVGICGGFTTFSSFSLESFELLQGRAYYYAGMYMFLSVFCCLVGIYFGKKLSLLF